MGIPVITNNAVGDLEEIIRNTATGFVLTDFTNESFMKLIDQLAGENNFNKAAIRTEAEKYYALPKAIQKYTALYTAILEE